MTDFAVLVCIRARFRDWMLRMGNLSSAATKIDRNEMKLVPYRALLSRI